jgi:tRNA-splicing endonuclease subunit Sen34
MAILLIKGEAFLVNNAATQVKQPTKEELILWDEFRRADALAQAEQPQRTAVLGPSKRRGKHDSEAVMKKKADREAKRVADAQARLASSSSSGGAGFDGEKEDATALFRLDEDAHATPNLVTPEDAPTQSSQPSIFSPSPLPTHYVTIPTTISSLPWNQTSSSSSTPASSSSTYTDLAAARSDKVWTYPSTLEERAKYAVFRDLHEKGYWMGGGLRFGGDWLVYPGSYLQNELPPEALNIYVKLDWYTTGDPLRYHSHFVATVYPTPTTSLRPIEIVALGRLGTATKKNHLLCGYDETTGVVDYYSLEWSGFG